jgi:uncharacterized membrane protein YgaE (UPF0421/DUF939 family)
MSDERSPAVISLEASAESHIAALTETHPEVAKVLQEILDLSRHYRATSIYYKQYYDLVRRKEATREAKAVNV